MVFYFFLFFFISVLLSQRNKLKNLNISALVFFILFITSAIRFDVGYDYMLYYDILNSDYDQFINETERMEPLNILLFKISRIIGFNQFYFIITSAIIFFSLYKVVTKFSKNISLSILLFMSLPIFYFNSFSIIRQFVAVSIVFYASTFIFDKKFLQYYMFVLIAFLFHKSALIGIILPLIFHYKGNFLRIIYVILFLLSIFGENIITYFASILLSDYYYNAYILRKLGTGGDKMLYIFQIISFFLLFIPYKKMEEKSITYMNAFFVGIFIWGALSPFGHAGVRGALYFTIFIILLIPELVESFNYRKIKRQIVYLITFTFYLLTLWLGINNPHKDPNIPYRISFFTDKTIYKIPKNDN